MTVRFPQFCVSDTDIDGSSSLKTIPDNLHDTAGSTLVSEGVEVFDAVSSVNRDIVGVSKTVSDSIAEQHAMLRLAEAIQAAGITMEEAVMFFRQEGFCQKYREELGTIRASLSSVSPIPEEKLSDLRRRLDALIQLIQLHGKTHHERIHAVLGGTVQNSEVVDAGEVVNSFNLRIMLIAGMVEKRTPTDFVSFNSLTRQCCIKTSDGRIYNVSVESERNNRNKFRLKISFPTSVQGIDLNEDQSRQCFAWLKSSVANWSAHQTNPGVKYRINLDTECVKSLPNVIIGSLNVTDNRVFIVLETLEGHLFRAFHTGMDGPLFLEKMS